MSRRTRRTPIPLINPIELAMHRAAKMTEQQRAELLAPGIVAVELLSRGAGSPDVWQQLADVYNIAEALAELRIAGNLPETLQAAQRAMAELARRVNAGRGWTLYAAELQALREGIWLYGLQLEHCSAGEHLRAIELVRRRVSAALRCKDSSRRVQVHDTMPVQGAAP